MKKKNIQLPKGYLSFSQIQLWKSDRQKYIALYMDNRDELRTSNTGQEYGKIVADALEQGVETGDILTDSAMLLLKKYDVADQEIRVEMKTKYGWLGLLGKPDTLNSKTLEWGEFKTGKNPWTQKSAQNHPQMKFYAMLIYLKYQKLTKEAFLQWIETEQTTEGIKPTGRVETFRVVFTLNDILKTMAETIAVAREIETVWVTHIIKPTIAY